MKLIIPLNSSIASYISDIRHVHSFSHRMFIHTELPEPAVRVIVGARLGCMTRTSSFLSFFQLILTVSREHYCSHRGITHYIIRVFLYIYIFILCTPQNLTCPLALPEIARATYTSQKWLIQAREKSKYTINIVWSSAYTYKIQYDCSSA